MQPMRMRWLVVFASVGVLLSEVVGFDGPAVAGTLNNHFEFPSLGTCREHAQCEKQSHKYGCDLFCASPEMLFGIDTKVKIGYCRPCSECTRPDLSFDNVCPCDPKVCRYVPPPRYAETALEVAARPSNVFEMDGFLFFLVSESEAGEGLAVYSLSPGASEWQASSMGVLAASESFAASPANWTARLAGRSRPLQAPTVWASGRRIYFTVRVARTTSQGSIDGYEDCVGVAALSHTGAGELAAESADSPVICTPVDTDGPSVSAGVSVFEDADRHPHLVFGTAQETLWVTHLAPSGLSLSPRQEACVDVSPLDCESMPSASFCGSFFCPTCEHAHQCNVSCGFCPESDLSPPNAVAFGTGKAHKVYETGGKEAIVSASVFRWADLLYLLLGTCATGQGDQCQVSTLVSSRAFGPFVDHKGAAMAQAAPQTLIPSILEAGHDPASFVAGITHPKDAAVLEFFDPQGQQQLLLTSTFEDVEDRSVAKLLTQRLVMNARDWPELGSVVAPPIALAQAGGGSPLDADLMWWTQKGFETFGESVGDSAGASLRECWYHENTVACSAAATADSGEPEDEEEEHSTSDADEADPVRPPPRESNETASGDDTDITTPDHVDGGGPAAPDDVELPVSPQGGAVVTTEHYNEAGTKYFCTTFEPVDGARVMCHVPDSRSP